MKNYVGIILADYKNNFQLPTARTDVQFFPAYFGFRKTLKKIISLSKN